MPARGVPRAQIFRPPLDYRAVLAAANALAANQRGHALGLAEVKTDLAQVKTELAGFRQETPPPSARSTSSSPTSRI
jgi:hypothetical protein